MTELMERVFAEACKLPPAEQDQLAERWMAELESEHRWKESFANSQEELSRLADVALAEDTASLTGEWKSE